MPNRFFKNYIEEHWISLLIIIIISIFICRNYFDSSYPMGTDMFGWIAYAEYFKNTSWYSWEPSSFGLVRLFTLQNLLILFNQIIDNPVYNIKVFILLVIILAGFSMYNFTYTYLKDRYVSLLAGILYIMSSFFIGGITSGHLNHAFAYSLLPLLFLIFDRALHDGKIKSILIFSILISIFANFTRLDVLFYVAAFFMLFIIITFIFSVDKNKFLKNIVKIGAYSLIAISFFSFFQLLPNIAGATPSYVSIEGIYAPIEHLTTWSLDLHRTMLGLSREIGYQAFLKGATWDTHPFLSKEYYFILLSVFPVIAYSAILFSKTRLTFFFGLSAIFATFLANGPREPFEELYILFFNNIPFFGSLRAPTRWLMIVSFAYAFLTGVFTKSIQERFPEKKYLSVILGFALISLIFVTNPFVLTHGLQTWSPPEQEINPHKWISNQSGDFRVATVPYSQPYMNTGSLIDISTGWWEHDIGTDSFFYNNRPVIGTGGWFWGISSEFVKYTLDLIVKNKTENLMKVLGTFDVKYLVLQGYLPTDQDILPKGINPSYQHIFFKNQKGLKIAYSYGNVTVYENEYWTPRIFVASKSAIVVGGRESLTALAELDEFNFRKWTLFFADQIVEKNGKEKYIDLLNKSDTLIFVNSEPLDLAMLMLDDATRITAAQYAYPSIDSKEHWIASDTATKMGMFALNSMTLSTLGENNVSIPFESEIEGSYEVWARLIYDMYVGKLSLSADDEAIGSIVPYSKIRDIKWVKLGNIDLRKGDHALTLQNTKSGYGATNEIDEIILVEPDKLANKIDEVNKQLENSNRIIIVSEAQKIGKTTDFVQRSNFPKLNYQQSEFKDYLIYYTKKADENEIKFPDIFKTEDSSPEVNFTRINPTKYKVKVKTDKPFFLIFSDSYHPLWRAYIDGEEIKSIISYSFVNGFYIQKTGEYEVTIEFIGQRYVWIGGIISLTAFIFAISYILFENRMPQIFRRIRKRLYGGNN